MNTFSQSLKKILKEKNITQSELSKLTGIGKSSLTAYLKGEYKPKQDKIYKIAKALEVSPFEIMGPSYFDNILDIDKIKSEIELFDKISDVELFDKISSCYEENETIQLIEIINNFNNIKDKKRLVDYSNNLLNANEYDLTAIVQDDSMKPKYNKGDRVYINFGYDFTVGDIYLIEYDNSTYIRKVFNDGYRVRLISLNDEYEPINIDIPIEKQFNIIGKVIGKKE